MTTSTSRRRTSAGSSRSRSSRTPSNRRNEDKPTRLRLKLSPPSKENEESTAENTQTVPPSETSRPPPRQPRQSSTASIDMCAPIIRPLKRTRVHDTSESDISVLDLGPSLTQPDRRIPTGDPTLAVTRTALLNAATRILEAEIRARHPLPAHPNPPPPPLSNEVNAYQPIQRPRAEESESEPVSSGSNLSPADESLPPISLRHQHPELHVDLQPRTGLRAPPRRRRISRITGPYTGDIHLLGYGYGFGGYERVQERSDFYVVESDSEGDIRSTSADASQSAQAARRRLEHPAGSWDRHGSDLFTTGLSEYEQSLELFPGVEIDEM